MLMSIFSASVLMESLMNLMLASSTLMKTMAAIWRRSRVLVIWFACCWEPFQCSSLLASWLGPGSVRTRPEEDTPGSLQKKTRRRRQSSRIFMQKYSSVLAQNIQATARFHRDYI